jgi:tetratricopeptide (TPR) repeat protein
MNTQIARQYRFGPRFFLLMLIVIAGISMISWWLAQRNSSTLPLHGDFFNPVIERASGSTGELVAQLQSRLRSNPDDWQAYSQLGLAYLQAARESGDPTFYQKAEQALKTALESEPEDYAAAGGMGALALARHQFREALDWGKRAQSINPERAYAYGVIADAQIELGHYQEAIQTLQTMVNLQPDMSSYARISYIRELHGDVEGALEIMGWAVDAGTPNLENTAWTRTQLGNLYFNNGQIERAAREYKRTLEDYPGYVYALAGLGRVYAAQDRQAEAIGLLGKAIEKSPLPEFVIALAEIYESQGQMEKAQEQFQLLQVIQELYRANGVDVDLEIDLFNADHAIDLEKTLSDARLAFERRPSIYAADVLAWVLFQNGRCEEARQYSQEALRLGTKDALKYFHAGMIAHCLGDDHTAQRYLKQALAINPFFSIRYATEAQRLLETLATVSTLD